MTLAYELDLELVKANHRREVKAHSKVIVRTSGYATWFTAGGAIRIGHYDVINDVITQKL